MYVFKTWKVNATSLLMQILYTHRRLTKSHVVYLGKWVMPEIPSQPQSVGACSKCINYISRPGFLQQQSVSHTMYTHNIKHTSKHTHIAQLLCWSCRTTTPCPSTNTQTHTQTQPSVQRRISLACECSGSRIFVWWVRNVVTCLTHELLLNTGLSGAHSLWAHSERGREGERGKDRERERGRRRFNNRRSALSVQLILEQIVSSAAPSYTYWTHTHLSSAGKHRGFICTTVDWEEVQQRFRLSSAEWKWVHCCAAQCLDAGGRGDPSSAVDRHARERDEAEDASPAHQGWTRPPRWVRAWAREREWGGEARSVWWDWN